MAAQSRRSTQIEHSINGPMTLGDLRWLVEQCADLADSSTVTVREYKSHAPTDWDEESIKVRGDIPR